MRITTPIIPKKQTFAKVKEPHQLNHKAICVFVATGFFLDTDSYWKDQMVLPPASTIELDEEGYVKKIETWFQWYNTPKEVSFNKALEDFTELFHTIVAEQTQNKPVILPLSGGLDSRTQAIALKHIGANVQSYSYQFQNGYNETKIAEQVAHISGFKFDKFQIPSGYLWNCIEELADINGCYSDFCSPRQMAILNQLKAYKGEFSLGHWGDVLFDDMQVSEDLPFEQQVDVVMFKITKKGGLAIAQKLWQTWEIEGEFISYFRERVKELLGNIKIPHSANARIRAFKSLYWAPRWTSINLGVFEKAHPIHLPYYDNRMCQFICSLPEAFLAGRQLQIAYIKKQNPKLAKLIWDLYHPFNLYTYQNFRTYKGLPGRMKSSLNYRLKKWTNKKVIQRNWELQFLGEENKKQLQEHLLLNTSMDDRWNKLLQESYNQFLENPNPNNAQAINMLLVINKKIKSQYED